MKKKIYLIHPSYRDQNGTLLKGTSLYTVSLSLPALSAIVPPDWEKECCAEYFSDIDFESDASVIAISSMGYEIFRGVEIAREFRKRGKVVLFGGFQPHINTYFVRDHCDAVVHGNPGVEYMARILRDVENGTVSSEYHCRIDMNYVFDYSVIDPKHVTFMPVLLSVGCRNQCDYCTVGAVYKGQYRLRHLSHLMAELDSLHRSTRRIAFVDTNMYNHPEYLRRVCREMIRRKYRFVWGGQTTLDIGEDPETLALLKRAGCKLLFIGMESINQENLDTVHKRQKAESFKKSIAAIHRAGLRIAAFFIYGFDGDTTDTASELSRFIIDQRLALPMLNVLVPTPGTTLYRRMQEENRILMKSDIDFLTNNPGYNASFNLCFCRPKRMTSRELEGGFIELLGRLSGWYQILRRSLSGSPALTIYLLIMNWNFRKEYLLLKRRRAVAGEGAPSGKEVSYA